MATHSGRSFAINLIASPGMVSGPGALFPGIVAASFTISSGVISTAVRSPGHSRMVLSGCRGNVPSTMASTLPGVPMPGIGRRTPNAVPRLSGGFRSPGFFNLLDDVCPLFGLFVSDMLDNHVELSPVVVQRFLYLL